MFILLPYIWNAVTKPFELADNSIGFNTDTRRFEFFDRDLKQWFNVDEENLSDYLKKASNISELTNDIGYLTSDPYWDKIAGVLSPKNNEDIATSGKVNAGSIVLSNTGNIAGLKQHYRLIIIDPNAVVVNQTSVICIVPVLDAQITITRIDITCEVDPATELDWNLKYADAFIGQANPILIAALDTVAGKAAIGNFAGATRNLTTAVVPAGKAIYVNFDATPAALPNMVCLDITKVDNPT